MPNELGATERTRVRREAALASTDRADLEAILDSALVCHLGVVLDGTPAVFPTGFGRDGNTLYVHGSFAARSLREASTTTVCVCVTLVDGIVYARSLFHHTMNYRSAMIYGVARLVSEPEEKLHGLRVLSEHLAPGQWAYARRPTPKELAATRVLALPLTEASVKVRSGPPQDEEADHGLPIWAGVLPLRWELGTPEPCPRLPAGTALPAHVAALAPRPLPTPQEDAHHASA